jgi:hypothetical protein
LDKFTAHRLRFVTEVQTTIELNEHQGSAIRGSLFHALRNQFCNYRRARECAACPLVTTCPVAILVSTLKPGGRRGRDVPRPYTVQPPLLVSAGQPPAASRGHPLDLPDGHTVFRYRPGEQLEFGLTLYAQALQLFPYVVLAVHRWEQGGIGRKVEENGWRRGTLVVREAWAENPLTGDKQPVMQSDENLVQVPDVPITHRQVCRWADARRPPPGSPVTIRLLTPARLIRRGHLLKPDTFHFQPLFQRLMERLEALSRHFSDTPLVFDDPKGLIEAAGRVRLVDNRLLWEELHSYSTRRRATSPTSGLVGSAGLEADDWAPFWPWLVWGQFVHVGKDAVKGNGWYRICLSYNT